MYGTNMFLTTEWFSDNARCVTQVNGYIVCFCSWFNETTRAGQPSTARVL